MKRRLLLFLLVPMTLAAQVVLRNASLKDASMSQMAVATNGPSFTADPTSVTCITNTDVSFTVVASGNPTPDLRWQTNNVDVANGNDYAGFTLSTLWASNVVIAQSNMAFQCYASNVYGMATSAVATLTVTNGVPISGSSYPAVSSVSTNANVAVTPAITNSITTEGEGRLLIAFVAHNLASRTNTSVTFGGQPFTELAQTNFYSTSGNIVAWVLANPGVGTSNVVANWTGGNVNDKAMIVVSITNYGSYGTPDLTYYDASHTTKGTTNTVTTATNGITVDVCATSYLTNTGCGDGQTRIANCGNGAALTCLYSSTTNATTASTKSLWYQTNAATYRMSQITIPISPP